MLVVVVRSKQETRTFEYDQGVITIGRSDVNDIVLPTGKVSKRHARLDVTPHGLVLTDLKSTNGTYLNGRKVIAPVLVGEGDHIHVGEFSVEVKSAKGLPNKLIARDLNLSVETVKDHVAAVLRALNVSSRTQAVLAVSQMTHQGGINAWRNPSR